MAVEGLSVVGVVAKGRAVPPRLPAGGVNGSRDESRDESRSRRGRDWGEMRVEMRARCG